MSRANFWRRLIACDADFIGRVVYFCPTSKSSLECIVNGDGTISPRCMPNAAFETACQLAEFIQSGQIEGTGLQIPKRTNCAHYQCAKDFFSKPGRRGRISDIFSTSVESEQSERVQPESVPPTDQSIADTTTVKIDNVSSVLHPMASVEREEFDATTVAPVVSPPPAASTSVITSPMASAVSPRPPSTASIAQAADRKLCPGLSLSSYTDVMRERQWIGDRQKFSPVIVNGDTLLSKRCEGNIPVYLLRCFECKKAHGVLRNLRHRGKKRQASKQRRILNSPDSWITERERRTKKDMLLRQEKARRITCQRKAKRAAVLTKELNKYRPKYAENRRAVRAAVQCLDNHSSLDQCPVCLWHEEDGAVCRFKGSGIKDQLTHVRETHLKKQLEENKDKQAWEKKYTCRWVGCRRRASFMKYDWLRRHMVRHTGCATVQEKATVFRQQLVNSVKAPTGRRYPSATKLAVMRNYRSRGQWERTRRITPLPLPSLRRVMGWKNAGNIQSGVDQQCLIWMDMAANDKAYLRHGILSFDEVYVNSQADIQRSSLAVFGYADDKPEQLAKSVLVFQYIGLFSNRRFAVCVAWYACVAIDANQLQSWLMEVLLQLEYYGFRVHGLVCDGHAVNRRLQKNLLEFSRAAGQTDATPFCIGHPMTTDREYRLFIFSDPSHVIKRMRNCWFNRDMTWAYPLNEMPIKWSDLRLVREWQTTQVRVDRPLTDKHFELDAWGKMSVRHAVDVFSYPIEAVMMELDPDGCIGTTTYMQYGRILWTSMNNRSRFTNTESTAGMIRNFAGTTAEMREWEERTRTRTCQFLTKETYEDILLLTEGVPAFVRYIFDTLASKVPGACFIPKAISQDPLEKTFGVLRQRGGGTQHITVKSIAYNLRAINYNIISKFITKLSG